MFYFDLSQREYEIQEMKQKYNEDIAQIDREATKFKTLVIYNESNLNEFKHQFMGNLNL